MVLSQSGNQSARFTECISESHVTTEAPKTRSMFSRAVYHNRWIPESPRWLMAENRLDEAQALLQKYARINGADVESKTLRTTMEQVKRADMTKMEKNEAQNTTKYSVLDLIKTAKLRKRTIICAFNW